MGESASARTERDLADLRRAIDRDVDAIVGRVREDVDPRNVARRNPLAFAGTVASLGTAAALALWRRARQRRVDEQRVDVLIERFGGRIDKLKGSARKRFRRQLREEMTEVGPTGPREVAWGAAAAALTALATTLARSFAGRLLGDDRPDGGSRRL